MAPRKRQKPQSSEPSSGEEDPSAPKAGKPWNAYLPFLFWVIPLALVIFAYFFIFKDLPTPARLADYNIPLATKIYDRHGTLLFDIFADENRTAIPLDTIPDHMKHATIAIEDKDFYKHGGINPIGGILRAFTATVHKQQLQGGSTITQQLVKSALLTPERTIRRKLREMVLAVWVEARFSKDKILELYLNQVPYGGTAWGVETAAKTYFGKDAAELTLAESSLLAGLPQAPTYYSPFGADPERSKNRQRQVLRRMVEDGYITQEEADRAAAEELVYVQETNINAPHFVMYVREQLAKLFGEELLSRGGLQVTTTLDLDLQERAQATVAAEIADLRNFNVTNGASLITKPATGEILAMIGSTDYFASPSGSFNVTTALRQPGSSIKPVNYAIGIEKQVVTPATMFLDIPTCFALAGQPNYCPKNYDNTFHGPVQLRLALGNSYNIPAVKMMYLNTVEDMIASASAFGIDTWSDPAQYGLSLTLGGGEVRMTDMAEAFGVFANGGIRKDLVAILKIEDKNGNVLAEFKDPNRDREIPSQLQIQGERAVSSETAFLISDILRDNNARQDAFGPRSNLYFPDHTVSVKTGTTDDLRDNWTIGYTPQFLVAAWVGNNDNSPMNPALISGVSGAAPIWNALMTHLLEDKPDIELKKPDGVVAAHVCTTSGLRPPEGEGGCETRFEYFIKGTVPTKVEQLKKAVIIDKDTGDIATEGKTENTEPQERSVLNDGISDWCIDCTHDEETPIVVK